MFLELLMWTVFIASTILLVLWVLISPPADRKTRTAPENEDSYAKNRFIPSKVGWLLYIILFLKYKYWVKYVFSLVWKAWKDLEIYGKMTFYGFLMVRKAGDWKDRKITFLNTSNPFIPLNTIFSSYLITATAQYRQVAWLLYSSWFGGQ